MAAASAQSTCQRHHVARPSPTGLGIGPLALVLPFLTSDLYLISQAQIDSPSLDSHFGKTIIDDDVEDER